MRRFLRKSQRRSQLTKRAADLLMQDQQQHSDELDERNRHLKDCFDTLADDHRKLLDGYYHKGYSVKILSEQNSRSIDAMYKRLQRIRKALRQCIELRMRGTEA